MLVSGSVTLSVSLYWKLIYILQVPLFGILCTPQDMWFIIPELKRGTWKSLDWIKHLHTTIFFVWVSSFQPLVVRGDSINLSRILNGDGLFFMAFLWLKAASPTTIQYNPWNIAPDTRTGDKRKFIFQPSIFRGYVSFFSEGGRSSKCPREILREDRVLFLPSVPWDDCMYNVGPGHQL